MWDRNFQHVYNISQIYMIHLYVFRSNTAGTLDAFIVKNNVELAWHR